ncbi:hypothetical protein ACP4J4_03670 [Aureimonas ureilytica]|uniref:hypothetical protein n=1 Tax=Aureimonas ureilytica TaxID=401562 RepID=UPI003CFB90CD
MKAPGSSLPPFSPLRPSPTRLHLRLRGEVEPLAEGADRARPKVGPDRPAPLAPRHVAVVGNAPEAGMIGAAVDSADWVFRFNNAQGFGGATGRRLTHLFLMNFGGQTREWLDMPGFHRRAAVARAQGFVLPIDPGLEERRRPTPTLRKKASGEHDWTPELRARLRPLGRPVWLLRDPLFWAAQAALREMGAGADPVPSTGFLALFLLVRHRPASLERIDVHGFGFGGWEGHSWAAERLWVERQARDGRLRLHPCGAPRLEGASRSDS